MKNIPLAVYQPAGPTFVKQVSINSISGLELVTDFGTYTYGSLDVGEFIVPNPTKFILGQAAIALADAINANPNTLGAHHGQPVQNPQMFAVPHRNMVYLYGRMPNDNFNVSGSGVTITTVFDPIGQLNNLYSTSVIGTVDLASGRVSSGLFTTSATAGTVTTATLPAGTRIVKIFPYEHSIRFALNQNPAAAGANAFANGGVALPGQWETRVVQPGQTSLRLRAAEASVSVEIEAIR